MSVQCKMKHRETHTCRKIAESDHNEEITDIASHRTYVEKKSGQLNYNEQSILVSVHSAQKPNCSNFLLSFWLCLEAKMFALIYSTQGMYTS